MDATSPPPTPAAGFAVKELKLIEHDRQLAFTWFSPCGRFLLGGDYDGVVCRWDVESGAKVALNGHGGWVQGLVFHPDGKQMFTADSWGQLIAWDYAADAPQPKWKTPDCHPTWLRGLAISPDGSTLATCGVDQFVRLWSSADGKPKQELPQHAEELFCVRFHPDGKSLVSGDLKGNVTHWDLAAGKAVRQLDAKALYLRPVVNGFTEINDVGGVRSLAFDPTGTTLACGGSQPVTSGFFTGKPLVILIDWATGSAKQSLQPADAVPDDGIVMDVSHHPGGFYLASCSGQPGKGSFWCWRPGEAAPLFIDKARPHCRTASLHPDGKRMALTQVLLKDPQQSGNGRSVGADGEYLGLVSHVRIFETTV